MSRTATGRSTAPAPSQGGSSNDICPVCKSSRYLNPNMKLKVNPECWHRMCESCVERIFGHGPAQCPIAGCRRTLRKHRFREQTFEDIQIEREVDIRREVNDVMNMREDDFETLMDYNNYLEDVETITFNLINNVDVAAARATLEKYKSENSNSISANASREKEERANAAAREREEREVHRLNIQAARRQAEEEQKAKAEDEQNLVNKLAASQGDANKIAQDAAKVQYKRAAARRQEQVEKNTADSTTNGDSFVIRGLDRRKKKEPPKPEAPYSPFAGVHVERQQPPSESYKMDWLDKSRNDVLVTAGGYDFNDYCQRALSDAFSGLGVFVGDEVAARSGGAPEAAIPMPGGEAT